MKSIISILITITFFSGAYAQKDSLKNETLNLNIGVFLASKAAYSKGTHTSSADNLYNFGISYSKAVNRYTFSLGPRLDYYSKILMYDKSAKLVSVFLQNQLDLNQKENGLFGYVNAGIAPKVGSDFYAGNIFEFGLGWQFKPKFITKKLTIRAGHNTTNLKNVYAEFHHSTDGINFVTTGDYHRLRLSSLALSLGISL